MKLTVTPRTGKTKGEIKKIRREGNIPAVIYGLGQAVEKITVKGEEFQAVLRELKPGLLATKVFELHLDGKKHQAIIKDVQYHVANYQIEHVDFALLAKDQSVTINVPIEISGAAECPGIKLGGTMRQIVRTLKVKCLPKDIPSEFQISIHELGLAESKRLSDIAIPEGVRPLALMSEVAVVIARSKVE